MSEEMKKEMETQTTETVTAPAEAENMVVCENLVKIYKSTDVEVVALQGLDLTVKHGEFTAIIGNSGSGKSTLLNMIGGFDSPSAGTVTVDGRVISKMDRKQLGIYRRESIGYMWQNSTRNLVPYLTPLQNVELPMAISGKKDRAYAEFLLEKVGLAELRNRSVTRFSGGELQRVAIAVALANKPKLLLADEPTGAVDTKTTDQILNLLRELNSTLNITVLVVTHDRQVANYVDRIVSIRDGKTSSEMLKRSYKAQLLEAGELGAKTYGAETHEEFAILDRAGRLQLPAGFRKHFEIGNGNRVKVEYGDNGQIILSVPKDNEEAQQE